MILLSHQSESEATVESEAKLWHVESEVLGIRKSKLLHLVKHRVRVVKSKAHLRLIKLRSRLGLWLRVYLLPDVRLLLLWHKLRVTHPLRLHGLWLHDLWHHRLVLLNRSTGYLHDRPWVEA